MFLVRVNRWLRRIRKIVPPAARPEDSIPESTTKPWREPALAILLLMVGLLYLWRLTDSPVHGEESRWARGAVHMNESGDFVVPRQQGQPFPERPPLNSWTMALLGNVFGSVDLWAVRLPSVLGVILCCAIAYIYARSFLTVAGAFAAGAIYATLGQVLQIGRLGESESLLAMFVTASLLSWHLGYTRGWTRWKTWTAAYVLAALAALTKGLQGPVYLVAITSVYLIWRGDWQWLFCRGHLVGIAAGASLIALWQIPFLVATDVQAVRDIWTGLVVDRITLAGLAAHMAAYPLETFACLLPWSLMAIQLLGKDVRHALYKYRYHLQFLVLAVAITYPSVWLVTGARGRYYMPLYGCLAVILAVIVQVSLSATPGTWAARGWHRFARLVTLGCAVACGVVLVATFLPVQSLAVLRIPPGMALAVMAASSTGVWITWRWSRTDVPAMKTAIPVIAAIAINLGIAYGVIAIQLKLKHGDHLGDNVAEVKESLPTDLKMVSFGPIHHRFAYHYQKPVTELPWPASIAEVDPDLEYFCIDRHVWDTPEIRLSGRGRTWTTTPGTLPFEWEAVAEIPIDPEYLDSECWVIVGRVVRDTDTGEIIAAETGQTVTR